MGGWFSAGRGGVSEGLNGVICSCYGLAFVCVYDWDEGMAFVGLNGWVCDAQRWVI